MPHLVVRLGSLILACVFLASCAGTSTAIAKRELKTSNKMSASIFLDPVPLEERTVLVQVRNTSDVSAFDIENQVISKLRAKGYQVTDEPAKAHYMLQANVLSVGQMDPESRQEVIDRGFGGGITGAAIGAGTGVLVSGHRDAVVGGALLGTLLGTAIDSSIKDVTYGVVTDVQISERLTRGQTTQTHTRSELKNGTASKQTITRSNSGEWMRYQTRIVSTANQANLKLDRATPALAEGMSKSIAGIF